MRPGLVEPSGRLRPAAERALPLLPLQNPQTLLPALRAQLGWIPSPRQGQKLERRPVPGRGHLARDRRVDVGRAHRMRNRAARAARPPPGLQLDGPQMDGDRMADPPIPVVAGSRARGAPVELPALAEVEVKLLPRCSLPRALCWAAAPRQNKRAAGAEALAEQRARTASSCGAASARASIYACTAFNTEERAGSIGRACRRTKRASLVRGCARFGTRS